MVRRISAAKQSTTHPTYDTLLSALLVPIPLIIITLNLFGPQRFMGIFPPLESDVNISADGASYELYR